MNGPKSNEGKAAVIADIVTRSHPSGGILVIVFDEEPVRGELYGAIACDGAFRMNPASIHTSAGHEAIAKIAKEVGEASRAAIVKATNELGGIVARANITTPRPANDQ